MAGGYRQLDTSESSTWNIAQNFSLKFIFEPMARAERWRTIALFGVDDLYNDLAIPKEKRDQARYDAFKWYLYELKSIVNSTKFKFRKDKKDKELMEEFAQLLNKVSQGLEKCVKHIRSKEGRELKINEIEFMGWLDKAMEIQTEMNEPLDRQDFIYPGGDGFDWDEQHKIDVEEWKEQG